MLFLPSARSFSTGRWKTWGTPYGVSFGVYLGYIWGIIWGIFGVPMGYIWGTCIFDLASQKQGVVLRGDKDAISSLLLVRMMSVCGHSHCEQKTIALLILLSALPTITTHLSGFYLRGKRFLMSSTHTCPLIIMSQDPSQGF